MTMVLEHAGHAHCTRCGCCQSFAPSERTTCGDCHALANCGEPDHAPNDAAALGRAHAERALTYGRLHPALARPLAIGWWEEQCEQSSDEAALRKLRRYYVDAFVAGIEAATRAGS